MKHIFTLTSLIFCSLYGFSQLQPDASVKNMPVFNELNPQKTFHKYNYKNLKPRSFAESYFLNYSFTNQPFAVDNNGGPLTVTFGRLNRNYTDNDRGTMQDLFQYVGGNGNFYHVFGFNSSTNKYVFNTIDVSKTNLVIDSMRLPFYYERNVNTTDSIIISIYNLSDVTVPNNQTNGGTPVKITYSGTPVYQDIIPVNAAIPTTDTFNFSGGTTFPYTNYLVSPNVTLPAGAAFGVRLQFAGDTANRFQPIFQMYDECNSGCVVTRAYIPNTTGYLNYIFNSNPPFNFSGAMNRQSMFACQNPEDDCSYYYYQTYTASYYVTSTTDFNVNIDPIGTARGCEGNTVNLEASYSGLDTLHTVSMLWKATNGGTFQNGADTFTGSSAVYTFGANGGMIGISLTGTASNSEVASDNITLENFSMNPTLSTDGALSCFDTDSLKIYIKNSADVGIASSLVSGYDALTTLNLATNLAHLDQYFGLTFNWSAGYPRTDTTFVYTKNAGNHTLTITNFVGCDKSVTYMATSTADVPTLSFTYSPSTDICPNEEITLEVSNSAYRSDWNYTWEGPDGLSATTTDQSITHKFTSDGNKTVKLDADSAGCKASQVSKTIKVLKSSDNKCNGSVSISSASKDGIKMYPNPVRDGIVNIEVLGLNKSASIKVTNLLGKVIISKTISASSVNQIDLADSASGIYFVEIESNGEKVVRKILVDKR